MNTYNINLKYKFVSDFVKVTWDFVLYGIEKSFFNNDFAIEYAISEVGKSNDSRPQVFEIASLFTGESINPYIEELVDREDINEDELKEKLLYVLLEWIFDNKEQFPNSLEMVERIYADFDYPVVISKIIGYMPPPLNENESNFGEEYLLTKWKEYLDEQQLRFGS